MPSRKDGPSPRRIEARVFCWTISSKGCTEEVKRVSGEGVSWHKGLKESLEQHGCPRKSSRDL